MVEDRVSVIEADEVPIDKVIVEDEVYTEVFGPNKHGRVTGYGRAMTQSRLRGSSSSQTSQTSPCLGRVLEEVWVQHA